MQRIRKRPISILDYFDGDKNAGNRHLRKRQKVNYDISTNDEVNEVEEEEKQEDAQKERQDEETPEQNNTHNEEEETEDLDLTKLDEKNKEILQNLDFLNAWIRGIRGVSTLLREDLNKFIENDADAEVEDGNIDLVRDILDVDLSQIDLSLNSFQQELETTKEKTTTFQKNMMEKLETIQHTQEK